MTTKVLGDNDLSPTEKLFKRFQDEEDKSDSFPSRTEIAISELNKAKEQTTIKRLEQHNTLLKETVKNLEEKCSDLLKQLSKEDYHRMCLSCGSEIFEIEGGCPDCSKENYSPEALISSKESYVYAEFEYLWKKAEQFPALRDRVKYLEEEQIKLRSYVDKDSHITEVKVAGRLLEKINSMIGNLDEVTKEARSVLSSLSKELEEARSEKQNVEKNIAEIIRKRVDESLKLFTHE